MDSLPNVLYLRHSLEKRQIFSNRKKFHSSCSTSCVRPRIHHPRVVIPRSGSCKTKAKGVSNVNEREAKPPCLNESRDDETIEYFQDTEIGDTIDLTQYYNTGTRTSHEQLKAIAAAAYGRHLARNDHSRIHTYTAVTVAAQDDSQSLSLSLSLSLFLSVPVVTDNTNNTCLVWEQAPNVRIIL